MMSFRDVASWVVRPLCSRKGCRIATVLLLLPSTRVHNLAFAGQVVERKPMELCHMEQPREIMHWRPKQHQSFLANLLPDSMKKFRPGSASRAALAAEDNLGGFAFISCPQYSQTMLPSHRCSLLFFADSKPEWDSWGYSPQPSPKYKRGGRGDQRGALDLR